MPLPLIPVGFAVASAIYGVKKGLDAKSDYDSAKSWNKKAQSLFDSAKSDLEEARESTQISVEDLGNTKFNIIEHSIIPYIDAMNNIKNFDFQIEDLEGESLKEDKDLTSFDCMNQNLEGMKDLVGGGIASLGAGGLAGLAAYGGVGALGTASTGTAIGSLSGVAASNATLAWLGGGSLASGGLGVAGGTAILGGIVAGPVLAVGGMMLASKAEEEKEKAWANYDLAELEAEKMGLAKVKVVAIGARFKELNSVLSKLNDAFTPLLNGVERINREEPKRLADSRVKLGTMILTLIDDTLRIAIKEEEGSKSIIGRIKKMLFGNRLIAELKSSLNEINLHLKSNEGSHFFPNLSGFSDTGNNLAGCREALMEHKISILSVMTANELPSPNFKLLGRKDKEGLHMAYSLCATLNKLVDSKVLDEDGTLMGESESDLESARELLNTFDTRKHSQAA